MSDYERERELRIRAEEDHRAAVEGLETYEARIRDIADHVLGIQDPTTPSIVLLDAIEREAGRRRIAQLQAEAAYLSCAEAIGVMVETDGLAPEPGPVEAVTRHIRVARTLADERHEAVERAERAERKAETFERDWYDAKSDFGTAMAKMREEVRAAHRRQLDALAELDELRAEVEHLRRVDAAARDVLTIALNDAGPEAFGTMARLRSVIAETGKGEP